MNRLTAADRTRAIACLVEGNSQRATCRITDLSRKAVARLSDDLGAACQRFANRVFVNLPMAAPRFCRFLDFLAESEALSFAPL